MNKNKIVCFAFQIFFLSFVAHSESVLVRSGTPLGSFALIYKLGRLFQQNWQNADEIEKEAEHREKLEDELFKREKSWAELRDERNQKVKELQERIIESRSAVSLNKDEPSEEAMRQ